MRADRVALLPEMVCNREWVGNPGLTGVKEVRGGHKKNYYDVYRVSQGGAPLGSTTPPPPVADPWTRCPCFLGCPPATAHRDPYCSTQQQHWGGALPRASWPATCASWARGRSRLPPHWRPCCPLWQGCANSAPTLHLQVLFYGLDDDQHCVWWRTVDHHCQEQAYMVHTDFRELVRRLPAAQGQPGPGNTVQITPNAPLAAVLEAVQLKPEPQVVYLNAVPDLLSKLPEVEEPRFKEWNGSCDWAREVPRARRRRLGERTHAAVVAGELPAAAAAAVQHRWRRPSWQPSWQQYCDSERLDL